MGDSMRHALTSREGNLFADAFQLDGPVERVGKMVAIRCLNGAIESYIVPRNLSRAEVAERWCGMSEANFSKVSNGSQGDFWALVYKLPRDIRHDFFDRLRESEASDVLHRAIENLHDATLRVLKLTSAVMPRRQVKAVLRTDLAKELAK